MNVMPPNDDGTAGVDAAAILKRRDFLVRTALVAVAVGVTGCEQDAQVCLSVGPPLDADATGDADSADNPAQPEVCLGAPLDVGPEAADTGQEA